MSESNESGFLFGGIKYIINYKVLKFSIVTIVTIVTTVTTVTKT